MIRGKSPKKAPKKTSRYSFFINVFLKMKGEINRYIAVTNPKEADVSIVRYAIIPRAKKYNGLGLSAILYRRYIKIRMSKGVSEGFQIWTGPNIQRFDIAATIVRLNEIKKLSVRSFKIKYVAITVNTPNKA